MEKRAIIQLDQSIQKVGVKLSTSDDLVNSHNLKIYEAAKLFKAMGLNITCIAGYVNEQNKFFKDILKHPCHEWKHLLKENKSEKEFFSYDWINAVGVGTITGVDNLVGIDIDGCKDIKVIEYILSLLELPSTYDWVVQTGSNNGYHIIIKMVRPNSLSSKEVVSTYKTNSSFFNVIEKVEILWNTHLVLPPSKHRSNNYYKFVNVEFPNQLPRMVKEETFFQFISKVLKTETKVVKRRYFE